PHTPRADRREPDTPRADRHKPDTPRDDRSEPNTPREERHEPDRPRDDRSEPDRSRPSSRVGSTAPEGRPDSWGDSGPGQGSHSSGHDSSGHDSGGGGHRGGGSDQDPTPGMIILGALGGIAERAFVPAAANKDEGRIRALLREVVDAVWATNPTA